MPWRLLDLRFRGICRNASCCGQLGRNYPSLACPERFRIRRSPCSKRLPMDRSSLQRMMTLRRQIPMLPVLRGSREPLRSERRREVRRSRSGFVPGFTRPWCAVDRRRWVWASSKCTTYRERRADGGREPPIACNAIWTKDVTRQAIAKVNRLHQKPLNSRDLGPFPEVGCLSRPHEWLTMDQATMNIPASRRLRDDVRALRARLKECRRIVGEIALSVAGKPQGRRY